MNALPGLNGSINGCNELGKVKKESGKHIGYVFAAHVVFAKNNGNGPPETKTVYKEHTNLRKQSLSAVPPNKIVAFSIA